jgi:acid stress-induced BolA-like protein IbaG/YrbA|tara:strand:- start:13301 stop:13546 length:246 start_codon:yes stop_codon:yes gene_type:complete
MMSPDQIKNSITTNLDCEFIEVKGDDGTHFEATIVSNQFEGISMVKQHQLVYESLGEMMKKDIHALSIKTYRASEWKELTK